MTLESLIHALHKDTKAFLTSSLREAYLAGLTAAEDSLMKHSSYEDRKDNSSYETGVVDGHRCALSSIKSLKEEAEEK